MSVKAVRVIVTVAVIVASVAFVWWRLDAEAAPPAIVRILSDPSGSQQRNCGGESRLAEVALDMAVRSRGSSIKVFMIGSQGTANEPVRLDIKAPRIGPARVLSDRSRNSARHSDFVDSVREACERFGSLQSSPVYIALKRMVEDAAVSAAGGPFKGYVLARSDLQDTEVPAIRKALTQRAGSRMSGLPPPIDNSNVDVFICGYAETIGTSNGRVLTRARQPDSSDRLIEVWKRLFTRPAAVRIEAYCDSQTDGQQPVSDPWGLATEE